MCALTTECVLFSKQEYLENALSGQQQRKQIEARVQQERQAFQQEAMLRR